MSNTDICLPNSNFNALYIAIGKAIDEALNENFYQNMFMKQEKLGIKTLKLINLIEKFSIGMIIFDEIQLINFNSSKENSFESLMVIANQTKIAMAVIGTEDSYRKMYTNLRTIRRVGNDVPASHYCKDQKYVDTIVKSLFKTQLFDERIEPTQVMLDTIFRETKGIIDMIIMLYIEMHDQYLSSKKRPDVNEKFISKIMNTKFSRIKDMLANCNNFDDEINLHNALREIEDEYDAKVTLLKQNEEMTKIVSNFNQLDISATLQQVVQSISVVTKKYSRDEIESKAKEIIGSNDISKLSASDITEHTFLALENNVKDLKKKSRKQKLTPKYTGDQMLNSLLK